MILAVDGPAAAGKGTLARRLAAHFNLAYLDTGALYRAIGLSVLQDGKNPSDPQAALSAVLTMSPSTLHTLQDSPALREEATGQAASEVAAHPCVRSALLDLQRAFALSPPNPAKGAILDGRDIGTVVCPDADAKIFVTASIEERTRRRVLELQARNIKVIEFHVLQDMKDRDARDSSRGIAPLRPADDAFVLDTSKLNAEAAFSAALEFLTAKGLVGSL